jgi:hypothetical protein
LSYLTHYALTYSIYYGKKFYCSCLRLKKRSTNCFMIIFKSFPPQFFLSIAGLTAMFNFVITVYLIYAFFPIKSLACKCQLHFTWSTKCFNVHICLSSFNSMIFLKINPPKIWSCDRMTFKPGNVFLTGFEN